MRACAQSLVAIELVPNEGRYDYIPTADAAFLWNMWPSRM